MSGRRQDDFHNQITSVFTHMTTHGKSLVFGGDLLCHPVMTVVNYVAHASVH